MVAQEVVFCIRMHRKIEGGFYIPFFWWYMVGFDEICRKIRGGLHCVRIDLSNSVRFY